MAQRPECWATRSVPEGGFPDMEKVKKPKESSSAYFLRTRPKFLDWEPPTEEQLKLQMQARRDAKQRELDKVTRLEKERRAAKQGSRK
ncbi:MAG: hypothetical protein WCA09_15040 [Burkholderiales bacterium]